MAKTTPAYRRRIYFIEKKFQAQFMLKFCALIAAGGICTMAILYLFTMGSSTVSIVDSRIAVKTTASFLLPLLIQTIAVVTVVTGLAAIAVTLFISHKIAGPIFRFKKVMNDIAEGDFSVDFRLRQDDQMHDMAGSLNAMILKTRGKLKELNGGINMIRKELEGINLNALPEDARTRIDELKKTCSGLEKAIGYFKI